MDDVKIYTTQELIDYFNEYLSKLPDDKLLIDMNFRRPEIKVIIEALHHYLDSDDCK